MRLARRSGLAALMIVGALFVRGAVKQRRELLTLRQRLGVPFVTFLRTQRTMLRALSAIFGAHLAYPGEDEVNAVLGFFSDIGDRIKQLITDAIGAAIGAVFTIIEATISTVRHDLWWIISGVQTVLQASIDAVSSALWWTISAVQSTLTGLIHGVAAAASAALDAAISGVESLVSAVETVLQDAVSAAASFAAAALSAAVGFLQTVIGDAVAVLTATVGAVRDALLAVIDGVIQLAHALSDAAVAVAQGLVGAAIDLAQSLVSGAISLAHALVDDIWKFVYDHIVGPLEDLGKWTADHAAPLLGVVEDALDWLVWVATIPFHLAFDLWHGLRDLDLGTVRDGIKESVGRIGGSVLGPIKDGLQK